MDIPKLPSENVNKKLIIKKNKKQTKKVYIPINKYQMLANKIKTKLICLQIKTTRVIIRFFNSISDKIFYNHILQRTKCTHFFTKNLFCQKKQGLKQT